jgi:flavodoxin
MNAIVVYESMYGNTRAIAEAVADGLGGAEVAPVHEAAGHVEGAELLVVGAPTHIHGLPTPHSRHATAEALEKGGDAHLEPGADDEPGLRAWLDELPRSEAAHAAAFDTRLDKPVWFTGAASHAIAKRLRRRGYDVLATESFLVEKAEGPLEDGELERARRWGRNLARSLTDARVAR